MNANWDEINFELERKTKMIAQLTSEFAEARKLCGEAATELVQYGGCPEDASLVIALRTEAAKGGGA